MMKDNSREEKSKPEESGKPDTCSYIFSSGKRCTEPKHQNDSLCFWHSPDVQKNKVDIKSRLEEKPKNGYSLEGFQLEKADLEDIYLIGSDLRGANLKRANLRYGHLFNINLQKANLFKTNLSYANLRGANLEDSDLLGTNLENALLERIKWCKNFKVKSEIEAETEKAKGQKDLELEKYLEAEEIYRNLKTNFKNRGFSTEGGKFFYREMVMKRKRMPLFSAERFWCKLMDLICRYGEDPFRIISFSFGFISINALLFCFLGIKSGEDFFRLSLNQSLLVNLNVVYNAVYFSFVTFTTLGYGDFTPTGFGKLVAIIEAYSGAFLMALFIITVYKNMMER